MAIERNLDGSFIETLAESGSPLPCAKPNEFDLYVATNSKGVQPAFPSSYLGDLYGWVPNLGQLRSLRVTGTLQILAIGERPRQPPCRINQVGGGFTFVLGNKVAQPRQVLFYSVSTFGYCLPDGPQWCSSALPQYYNPGRPGLGPHGEVTGVGFGFGDPLASYGQHKFSDTQPHALDLDVLPVLRRWIQTGTTGLVHGSSAGQPYKLDTDISHWTVGGFYYGQAIWGGAYMSTRWTGFVPIMTTGVPEPAVAHAKPPSTP